MNLVKFGCWGLLLVVGCNGKLTPDPGDGIGGSGGEHSVAGSAGKYVGTAGHAGAGVGGHGGADVGTAGNGQAGFTFGGSNYGTGGVDGVAGNGTGGVDGVAGYASGGVAGYGTGGDFTTAGIGGSICTNCGGAPPVGSLGQPCIPGGLVTEADGSPAKTQIRVLTHCNDGLSCNAQGQCVAVPDCPQSGDLCVMRRAALSEGSGGGSGSMGGSSSVGTAGTGQGGNGQTVYISMDASGVTALTSSESRVYWVEYGTRDPLGNYKHDGALLAYTIADGTTSVVASGLEGPIGVELTTSHAYVYVDGARPIGTPAHSQLLRVPLAGGSAELVQDGARPSSFAAAGSRAFWIRNYTEGNPAIFSMTSDANAVPTEYLSGSFYGTSLTIDATDLYYSTDQGLMRSAIASAAPVALGITAGEFVLHGDGVFGLESITAGGLLRRAPKTGGEYLRVRALGSGTPSRLRAVGDRYFLSVAQSGHWTGWGWASTPQVLTAGFVGTEPPIRLLDRTTQTTSADQLWVGTADTLYWSDGRTIYKQPLPTP